MLWIALFESLNVSPVTLFLVFVKHNDSLYMCENDVDLQPPSRDKAT